MRYKLFGRKTGLRVSEVALGAGMFGTGRGYGAEPEDSRKIFNLYAEADGNFIDIADTYQYGQSETLIGDFIAADRDHFIVASKFSVGAKAGSDTSRTGNSRKNMIYSVEASLKRLKTDYIDLYWVHMADGVTPVDEIARAFDDLVRAGKIRYAGLSDFPAWRVARASTIAELRGWAPIAGLQIEYSLVERTSDRDLLPMAEALGLGTTLWSPLGGGFLTGKYRVGAEGRKSSGSPLVHSESNSQKTAILDEVQAVAKTVGASPAQVAIAWLRQKAAQSTTSLIPILGARTADQLQESLGGLKLSLPEEALRRLESVSAIPLGFPHEMLANAGYVKTLAGGKSELMDYPVVPPA
jgi:aryl-alcohol dehydrogenase-like predicted oxidoreductase